ncbi:hypothetical protein DV704_08870 [Meiothermus sp. QL-1]|uniref:hypothetical protein n=1 Tax=Meiothermus sp. QL-1 TaxID=2058095 RepID=UPI000E0A1C47|nr:hypothetical protein [Meiothermus sp. QL-1]RDI94967.1 hypothetical protein DV704_08870 [Meiothermus sp. QL-1]
MHRAWAARRAWWVRLGLALGLFVLLLPLVLWLHPAWGLLSALGLLYPSRLEEARALAELDRRFGLAYRSALEAPPRHPWRAQLEAEAEASLREARLPAFPWGMALLYLLLVGVAWVLPPLAWPPAPGRAQAEAGTPSSVTGPPETLSPDRSQPPPTERQPPGQAPPTPSQPAAPSEVEQGPSLEDAPQPGTPEQTFPAEPSSEPAQSAPSGSTPSGSEPGAGGGQSPSSPGEGQAGPPSSAPGEQPPSAPPGAGRAPTTDPEASGGQPLSSPGEGQTSPPALAPNGQPSPQPGANRTPPSGSPSPEPGTGGTRPSPSPTPGQGPGGEGGYQEQTAREGLPTPTSTAPLRRGESSEGRPMPLPSPWQAGRPPENVQRQVERYLESEPLPPEVREVLRRYFELPQR